MLFRSEEHGALAPVWNPADTTAYCNEECLIADALKMESDRTIKQRTIKQRTEREVLRRFPGARALHFHLAYGRWRGDNDGTTAVNFSLPGGITFAEWHSDKPDNVTIQKTALPQWHAYRAWVRQNSVGR